MIGCVEERELIRSFFCGNKNFMKRTEMGFYAIMKKTGGRMEAI